MKSSYKRPVVSTAKGAKGIRQIGPGVSVLAEEGGKKKGKNLKRRGQMAKEDCMVPDEQEHDEQINDLHVDFFSGAGAAHGEHGEHVGADKANSLEPHTLIPSDLNHSTPSRRVATDKCTLRSGRRRRSKKRRMEDAVRGFRPSTYSDVVPLVYGEGIS